MQIEFQGRLIPVTINPTPKALSEFLGSHKLVGIDIETAERVPSSVPKPFLSPTLYGISLIQLYAPDEVVLIDFWSYDDSRRYWYNAITKADCTYVAHNALYECRFLPSLAKKIRCSAILHSMVTCATDAKANYVGSKLDEALEFVTGERISKKMQKSDWSERPLSDEQLEYAALDAVATYTLYQSLIPAAKKLNLKQVYDLNCDCFPVITDMHLTGVPYDAEAHSNLRAEWREQCESAEILLRSLVGDININSNKQISEWVLNNIPLNKIRNWERTKKTGDLGINKDQLIKHRHLPVAQALIEYSRLEKLESTYGEKLANFVNPVTKQIHPSFRIGSTTTARWSCSNPNLQNQPRSKDMRACYALPEDSEWTFSCADYGQLELRVLATISEDEAMMDVYREGRDIYSATAAYALGCAEEDIDKDGEPRRLAKAVVLGLNYGMGVKKLAEGVRNNYGIPFSDKEAQRWVDSYFARFPDMRKWQKRVQSEAKATLMTYSKLGKPRKLSLTDYYTVGANHPIQATASEIGSLAAKQIGEWCRGKDKLILFVHDEFLVKHLKINTDYITEVIEKSMLNAALSVLPTIPVYKFVSVKTANSWAEAK